MKSKLLFTLLILLLSASLVMAQTGKIAGRVTDAATGNPLPGANVVIEGLSMGAATDMDGFYFIINVPPGTYTLDVTYVGYTKVTSPEVRVNINLTSTENFQLREQALAGEAVVVVAERPIVQPDISANVANVNVEEIVNIPITGVTEFINLQAGIEPGMTIRGSGNTELAFIVDGTTLRDGRDNDPITNISYTAVEELQIQTGGFNAEYGNVRSGLINVVTKRPSASRYSASMFLRYTPDQPKHFGGLPSDPDSYWMRPYLDPSISYIGTQAGLDIYDQRQYPTFEGWNELSRIFNEDDDPTNDLTPDQLIEAFKWSHRKAFAEPGLGENELDVDLPDYVADATLTGPVPLISKPLGNLRFLASYRKVQTAYIVPMSRDRYDNYSAQFKVISDLSTRMKLQFTGLVSQADGIESSGGLANGSIWTGAMPVYPWQDTDILADVDQGGGGEMGRLIFQWHQNNETRIRRNSFGLEFTHTLSPRTFYKVKFQRNYSDYLTGIKVYRDLDTIVKTIGPMQLDESPWGYDSPQRYDVVGMNISGNMGEARDTTNITIYSGRLDVESQVNRFMQMKAGVELDYWDYVNDESQINAFLTIQSQFDQWERQPIQGGAYLQTKLEFEGMIANLGTRLDYFNPNGQWYIHGAYDPAFSARVGVYQIDEVLEKRDLDSQWYLSPRLGVAFPITVNSKFFFNYGHFRQNNNIDDLFAVQGRHLGYVEDLGNPDLPMPRTIAYELGYEHNLGDMFLIRSTGYYKDVSEQPRWIHFLSRDQLVTYDQRFPYNYSDTRGLEITLEKRRRGGWFRGFINYTYMARSTGNFGYSDHFESVADQRDFERTAEVSQNRLIPEPYGRFNIEFFTPDDFGPKIGNMSILGGWAINFLGDYRSGVSFQWNDGINFPGLGENVKWKSYYNLDLRITKHFNLPMGNLQLYLDVENVFNLKHLHRYAGFNGDEDFEHYMRSLHLPEDIFGEYSAPYSYIPGNDQPGDFRDFDVEWVPIEIRKDVKSIGDPVSRALYYEPDTKLWYQWTGSEWQYAKQTYVKEVMDTKAYIDMPNQKFYTFINPRIFRLGLKIWF